MSCSVILMFACIAFLPTGPSEQEPSAAAKTQDVQNRAEALLEEARQLSDIRSPHAPAFRLKATFSFVGDKLETIEGSYNELWVSKSQWRREIAVGDLRHIEVAGPGKLWLFDTPGGFPEKAKSVSGMMEIFYESTRKFDFESILDHSGLNPPTQCAVTKPGARHDRYAFCFEKKSGVLLERISPEIRPRNLVDNSCAFRRICKIRGLLVPP